MTTKDTAMKNERELSKAFIGEVSQNIAELCDRQSPEEYPDCMLVTHDELEEIMLAVHEDVPAVDCAPLLSRIAELEAENAELAKLLESAQNGLHWYQQMHPEDDSETDNELHGQIDAILTKVHGNAAIDAAMGE